MGNSGSAPKQHQEEEEDIWWTNGNRTISQPIAMEASSSRAQTSTTQQEDQISLSKHIDHDHRNSSKFNELMFDMERNHEKRREILAAKKKQFEDLREEVRILKEENDSLKNSRPTQSQEEYVKEIQQLQQDNEQLKLLLSSKQSGGVLLEEMDLVLRENATLKGELKDKVEELGKVATLLDKNRELRIGIAEMQSELQSLNGVVVEFEKERDEYKAHVVALKDVIAVSKKMLLIRESQLKELREKVESIEESLSGKEMNILSQDLRLEYERQLQSIRNLRALYEERQRTDYREKEDLKKIIEETKKEVETEQNKNKEAEERIGELEELNSQNYDQIKSLESNLGLSKAESRQYQAELTVINQLFSEILLGFNSSQEIDLDKLTKHLVEHHELLKNIVINEICSETSFALPKVLLDLLNQVNTEEENIKLQIENVDGGKLETIIEESESQTSTTATDQINSAEEIVQLLPKVWRVLIELLGHQRAPTNTLSNEESSEEDPCYKTVQTPKGPSLVLSVSQTFIRLKDLILEKKSLEKETGHLKQLNTHLETRLQDQEKRLGMVTSELNKTWHVVGKLQKQHQLLHTQEKILRYELAQKRKLLTTLKEELEYSREKWQEAREKNAKTEKQWRQLRVEFASRRKTVASDECSTSGYSDERSSDDEPGYETDVSESVPKQIEDTPKQIEDAPKQIEDVPTQIEDEPTDNEDKVDDRSVTNQLDNSTDAEEQEQVTPIPSQIEEARLDDTVQDRVPSLVTPLPPLIADAPPLGNTVQDRVALAEQSIEITNTSIESKRQSNYSAGSEKKMVESIPDSSRVREASTTLVSSVIDEAISAILQDSNQNDTRAPDPSNKEAVVTNDVPDFTEKSVLQRPVDVDLAPSVSTLAEAQPKSLEDILAAREERLKRLEGQCEQLVEQVTSTTHKSVIISNKLDSLHEVYGEGSSSQSGGASTSKENVEVDKPRDDNQE